MTRNHQAHKATSEGHTLYGYGIWIPLRTPWKVSLSSVWLGDGQTEVGRVTSQCWRGDALLRRMLPHLTCRSFSHVIRKRTASAPKNFWQNLRHDLRLRFRAMDVAAVGAGIRRVFTLWCVPSLKYFQNRKLGKNRAIFRGICVSLLYVKQKFDYKSFHWITNLLFCKSMCSFSRLSPN